MSRTNSQAEIVFKEQLVSRATRLVIKKNNPRVASDPHINDTISLTGKDSSWDKVRLPILQILWGIVHSANLDFTSLIWDEYECQAVERSSRPSKMSKLLYTRFTNLIINHFLSNNKSIPRRSSSKLHSSQDDQPITKLSNTVKGDYKFGMKIPDTMTSDAIKKLVGYKFYMTKKVESENAEIVDEPEEKHASPVKSGRGKGFMCYGDQAANVLTSLKIDDVPSKTRSQTIAEETVVGELANSISIQELRTQQCRRIQLTINSQIDDTVVDMYAEWGQKLKGPVVEDPAQAVVREGSSAAHNKYYDSSDTDSDAILYSSSSDKTEESDDADEYDMDLSNDNPDEDDDATGYGVFMHTKSTATPNSTYLSPTVTSSSLDFIQTLLDESHVNELTDFMSHPVYTDAQTTSVVYNPEGNLELTSYISGASGVPLATKTSFPTTFPKASSSPSQSKKLMQKGRRMKIMRKINFRSQLHQGNSD
ncbi:hypothetical protein Tco_1576768 [Tanacetum coccineum]